jgi:hypothetical protein
MQLEDVRQSGSQLGWYANAVVLAPFGSHAAQPTHTEMHRKLSDAAHWPRCVGAGPRTHPAGEDDVAVGSSGRHAVGPLATESGPLHISPQRCSSVPTRLAATASDDVNTTHQCCDSDARPDVVSVCHLCFDHDARSLRSSRHKGVVPADVVLMAARLRSLADSEALGQWTMQAAAACRRHTVHTMTTTVATGAVAAVESTTTAAEAQVGYNVPCATAALVAAMQAGDREWVSDVEMFADATEKICGALATDVDVSPILATELASEWMATCASVTNAAAATDSSSWKLHTGGDANKVSDVSSAVCGEATNAAVGVSADAGDVPPSPVALSAGAACSVSRCSLLTLSALEAVLAALHAQGAEILGGRRRGSATNVRRPLLLQGAWLPTVQHT